MKNLLLISFLCVSYLISGQNTEFQMSSKGFTDFIIAPVKDLSKEDIYKRTLSWVELISQTYWDSKIEKKDGGVIIFECYKENATCNKHIGKKSCQDIKYSIQISVKDGKYKFDPTRVQLVGRLNKQEKDFDMNNTAIHYRGGGLKKMSTDLCNDIEKLFNKLNKDLLNHIKTNPKVQSKKSEW